MLKRFIIVLTIAAAVISCTANVFAAGIDHDAAEKLAADFLSEISHVETAPETYKFDCSPYTSVEKFREYMYLHMRWVRELAKIQGGRNDGDKVTFEAAATDFEDVDGGLLVTMHTTTTYYYADSDEPGISENSVYVLVAEGESGLEIRDYNDPHTGWDGIRGDSFIPKDPYYWITSPDIEAVLENVMQTIDEGLKIYAEDYGVKEDALAESKSEVSSPNTGVCFSMILPLIAVTAAALTGSSKKPRG